jgi:rubredoxin
VSVLIESYDDPEPASSATPYADPLDVVVPVPVILFCPSCHARHIDTGKWADKVHHTHACQACGFTWRPAVVPTVGVEFLPGFKDAQ